MRGPRLPLPTSNKSAQWKPALQQFLDNPNQPSSAAKVASPSDSREQLINKVTSQMMVNSFMSNSMTKITNIMVPGKP
jgi:hypothetical protein